MLDTFYKLKLVMWAYAADVNLSFATTL